MLDLLVSEPRGLADLAATWLRARGLDRAAAALRPVASVQRAPLPELPDDLVLDAIVRATERLPASPTRVRLSRALDDALDELYP